jgi:allophanate hydrolase
MTSSLRFHSLRDAYRRRTITPIDVVERFLERQRERGEDHVWAACPPEERLRARARELSDRVDEIDRLPLYGLTFGVKDNVDVAGVPTTCGCPGYSRLPERSAVAVDRAIRAGALFVGKQTLDQFATGLNGTRVLGGHCANVFDRSVIPGGSSSGSGVAVAAGLVSFSLGSDTGGSGRVPAAMNNIVGLRPTVGLVSTRGMVLNNPSIDCMPVFAPSVEEAFEVLEVISGRDTLDPTSRPDADAIRLDAQWPSTFRFGVPATLECFGDAESERRFDESVRRLRQLGGEPIPFDFEPFREAGSMVFDSALVAERNASYGEVLERCPEQLVRSVAAVLERGRRYSAVDAFRAQYRMAALRLEVAQAISRLDVLVTPTVPRPFLVSEMLEEPLLRNAEVGYYTYGVGPLDLCALALPAALRSDGLPFGVSLVARAGEDGRLRALGRRFEESVGLPPGIEALR